MSECSRLRALTAELCVIDGPERCETLSQGECKEISAETHQISDQRHSFPLPEVWHAVNAVQSTTHPGDKACREAGFNGSPGCKLDPGHDESIKTPNALRH